ncbi:hypothetical protein Misp02_46080 [Microtetraspora sp. NBRC 16547]|nr:hypothetical protein Misp02_46080 [Microtetraspora sp. NBRC 16547]
MGDATAAGASPEEARSRPGRWEPGEDGPEGFYRKLGFQLTGEQSEGQTVGVLDLTNPA